MNTETYVSASPDADNETTIETPPATSELSVLDIFIALTFFGILLLCVVTVIACIIKPALIMVILKFIAYSIGACILLGIMGLVFLVKALFIMLIFFGASSTARGCGASPLAADVIGTVAAGYTLKEMID